MGALTFYERVGSRASPVAVVRSGVGKVNAAVTTLLLLQRGGGAGDFRGRRGRARPRAQRRRRRGEHRRGAARRGPRPRSATRWARCPANFLRGRRTRGCVMWRWRRQQSWTAWAWWRAGWRRVTSLLPQRTKSPRSGRSTGPPAPRWKGASSAQVCAKWGVPFVIVRSISDTADGAAGADFRTFTPLAAERRGAGGADDVAASLK